METLKDINDEIGYSVLKKYLFPSRAFKQIYFKEKNDDCDDDCDDDTAVDDDGYLIRDRLNRVKAAVYREDAALLYKNHNCDAFTPSDEPLDVIRLLREGLKRKGRYLSRLSGEMVQDNQLEGKYVMICCLSIPHVFKCTAWTAVAASDELFKLIPGNFEMVIVGRMRRGWSCDEVAFFDFLSPFSRRCLVVPFKDKSLRGLICNFLGVALLPSVLLVDPHGDVLLYHELGSFSPILLVPWYGRSMQPFPFIQAFCKKLPSDADDFQQVPSDLRDCLGSKKVFKISYSNGNYSYSELKVSNFKSKVVGIYLYTDGELLPLIRKMDQDCTQSGKEMEIVIVNLPISLYAYHHLFPRLLGRSIARQNLSWWFAPFNFSAYSILNHLFCGGEMLLIKEPNTDFIEPRGADFFKTYGVDAYPFAQSSGYSLSSCYDTIRKHNTV